MIPPALIGPPGPTELILLLLLASPFLIALLIAGSRSSGPPPGAIASGTTGSKQSQDVGALKARYAAAADRMTTNEIAYLRSLVYAVRGRMSAQNPAGPLDNLQLRDYMRLLAAHSADLPSLGEGDYLRLRGKLPSATDPSWPGREMAIWTCYGLEMGLAGHEARFVDPAVLFAACVLFGVYERLGESLRGMEPQSDSALIARADRLLSGLLQ